MSSSARHCAGHTGGSDRIRTEMSRTTEKDGRGGRKTVKRKRSNGKGFGQKTANDRSGQGKAKTGGRPKKTLRNVHKKK